LSVRALGQSNGPPAVGFGTLIPDPVATKQASKTALEVGFRHLDCAERYRNEEAVGDAIQEAFKAGRIRREDVFVRQSSATATRLFRNAAVSSCMCERFTLLPLATQ
jgi:diketogulonate reductase-like aldo/keto reductase